MKTRLLAVFAIVLGLSSANSQQLQFNRPPEFSDFFPNFDLNALQPVPLQAVPNAGTFWYIALPGQAQLPPFPCPPPEMDHPVYFSSGNTFFVDESVTLKTGRTRYVTQPPPPGSGGYSTNPPPIRPNIVNEAKYGAQVFSHLDTNAVANSNTNLYGCITNFPPANAGPVLQIKLFGANCVVVKPVISTTQQSRGTLRC